MRQTHSLEDHVGLAHKVFQLRGIIQRSKYGLNTELLKLCRLLLGAYESSYFSGGCLWVLNETIENGAPDVTCKDQDLGSSIRRT